MTTVHLKGEFPTDSFQELLQIAENWYESSGFGASIGVPCLAKLAGINSLTGPYEFVKLTASEQPPTGDRLKLYGFMTGCCIIKPVTVENKSYLLQRARAAYASVGIPPVSDSTLEALATACASVSERLARFKQPLTKLVLDVSKASTNDTLSNAFIAQLTLLITGRGLVAITLMAEFCRIRTLAHLVPSVYTEAGTYLQHYDKVRKDHPLDFDLLYLLQSNDLAVLHHRLFPNLYIATISWAKHAGKLNNNYTETRMNIQNAQIIKRAAREDLHRSYTADDAMLASLGLSHKEYETYMKRLFRKKSLRVEESDSESDSSDDETLRKKKKH